MILAKLLPAIAVTGIIKVGLAKFIATTLPLLDVYIDLEGIRNDNRLQNVIDDISSKFFPNSSRSNKA